MDSYADSIRNVIHMFMTYGQTHQPFAEYGGPLLNIITVIAISIAGIKLVLDFAGPNEIIGNIINTIFVWGLASFFLVSNAGQMIDKGFSDLADKAVGVSSMGTSNSAEDGVLLSMGKFMSISQNLFSGRDQRQAAPADPQQGMIGQAADYFKQKIDSVMSGDFIMSFVNALYKLFIALLIMLTGMLYVAQYLVTQVMVQLGFMVMPIMVPWIMLESTSFIFNGWWKFMVSAGLTKVIGAIIFGMSSGLLTSIVDLAEKAGQNSGGQLANFGLYSVLLLLTGLMAYLMLQTTTIAHGLLSGSAHGKFVAPGKMQPGGLATSGSRNITSGAKSAVQGVKAGAKAAGSMASGFKAGLNARKSGQSFAQGVKNHFNSPSSGSSSGTSSASSSSGSATQSQSSIRSKLQDIRSSRGR